MSNKLYSKWTGRTRLVKKYYFFGPLVLQKEYIEYHYEDSSYPCVAMYETFHWKTV